MIEREGYGLFVSFSYEYFPEFGSNCSFVGHSVGSYRCLPGNSKKPLYETPKTRKEFQPTNCDIREKNVKKGMAIPGKNRDLVEISDYSKANSILEDSSQKGPQFAHSLEPPKLRYLWSLWSFTYLFAS